MAARKIANEYNKFADKVTDRSIRKKEARLERKLRNRSSKTESYVRRTPSKVHRLNASANAYIKKKSAKNIKAAGHALAENTAGATTAASYNITDDYLDEKKKKKDGVTPTTSVLYQGNYDNNELEQMPGGDSSYFNSYRGR